MDLPITLGLVALAAILAVISLFIPMLFRRIVPANEVHVLNSGKNTTPYGQITGNGNVYYKWPTWIPVIGVEVKILSTSIFDIELDQYEAYDKGRLQFLVDVTAFFRINDYAVAAQRVSSNQHLTEQLTSIVQGAVRSILAKSEIEEIMEERSILGEKFTNEVKEQLKSWGIEAVKNIELMDIKDAKGSEIIHNIMAKKKSHIEMESRLEVAKNRKLAEVAEIEAKREVDLNKQEAQQQVGLRTVEAQQKVAMAEESKKQTIIEQTKLTTEREMEVQKISSTRQAEIEKEVALVNAARQKETALIEANKAKEVALIEAEKMRQKELIDVDRVFQVKTKTAEAEAKVKTTTAEADFEMKKKNAEADLDVKTKLAEGLKLEGLAKAEALKAEGLAFAEGEKAKLMAPVEADIARAKEIGENEKYQEYLLSVERIKSQQAVGVAQAEALSKADIRIIANSGDASTGIESIKDVLSSKGGTQLGLLLEGLTNTELGKKLVDKVLPQ